MQFGCACSHVQNASKPRALAACCMLLSEAIATHANAPRGDMPPSLGTDTGSQRAVAGIAIGRGERRKLCRIAQDSYDRSTRAAELGRDAGAPGDFDHVAIAPPERPHPGTHREAP